MVDGRDNPRRSRAPGPHAHRNTAKQAMDGLWTEARGQQKPVKRPQQQPAHPQYVTYWAPLTRKWHTMPHPAQPQHTKYWAPRTRKRHQQEHRPQRPTESSDPMQHAKGRTGDCPGPRKGATTRRNVTQGAGRGYLADSRWVGIGPPTPTHPPPNLTQRHHVENKKATLPAPLAPVQTLQNDPLPQESPTAPPLDPPTHPPKTSPDSPIFRTAATAVCSSTNTHNTGTHARVPSHRDRVWFFFLPLLRDYWNLFFFEF